MSSSYVRTHIQSFLTTGLAPLAVLDLSGQYDNLNKYLAANGLNPKDGKWIGLQYFPSSELPINIGANNTQGCYREEGLIYIHVVNFTYPNATSDILTNAEAVRDLLRGQRINGNILIEEVTPPAFEAGGTLQFDGGWISAAVSVQYQYDRKL
jgi:hypothetical protein